MEEERVERDQEYVHYLNAATDLYCNAIMAFSASFPRNSCFSFQVLLSTESTAFIGLPQYF